jgi:precorrin-3B synthase
MIPARALAATLVPALALAAHSLTGSDPVAIHISGCAKGCAYPRPATLTVVGTEQGCGIIRDGSARAAPCRHIDPTDLAAEVARLVVENGARHG